MRIYKIIIIQIVFIVYHSFYNAGMVDSRSPISYPFNIFSENEFSLKFKSSSADFCTETGKSVYPYKGNEPINANILEYLSCISREYTN